MISHMNNSGQLHNMKENMDYLMSYFQFLLYKLNLVAVLSHFELGSS